MLQHTRLVWVIQQIFAIDVSEAWVTSHGLFDLASLQGAHGL